MDYLVIDEINRGNISKIFGELIALIDIALRRRFTFLKMKPKSELVPEIARDLFVKLNDYIKNSHLGEDYQIGHSYFMKIEDEDDLDFVLEYKIKPLLEEYYFGDKDNMDEVLKICNRNKK